MTVLTTEEFNRKELRVQKRHGYDGRWTCFVVVYIFLGSWRTHMRAAIMCESQPRTFFIRTFSSYTVHKLRSEISFSQTWTRNSYEEQSPCRVLIGFWYEVALTLQNHPCSVALWHNEDQAVAHWLKLSRRDKLVTEWSYKVRSSWSKFDCWQSIVNQMGNWMRRMTPPSRLQITLGSKLLRRTCEIEYILITHSHCLCPFPLPHGVASLKRPTDNHRCISVVWA